MTRAWLATVDQDVLIEQRDQQGLKQDHTNPSELGAGCPIFNANDTCMSIDNLKQYLATQWGVKKAPLDYVVCSDTEPPPSATDDHDQYTQILKDGAHAAAAGK